MKPLIQTFFPRQEEPKDGDSDIAADLSSLSTTEQDIFTNISITLDECSVVCKTDLADRFYRPFIAQLPKTLRDKISISKDAFMIFQINAQTMESGQRVVQVTAPLATAGISIFFITTYYADFVLFPKRDRKTVVNALLKTGFRFEQSSMYGVSVPPGQRVKTMSNSDNTAVPMTDTKELQRIIRAVLKANEIRPGVQAYTGDELEPLLVVSMAGIDGHNRPDVGEIRGFSRNIGSIDTTHDDADWLKHIDKRLYLSIVNVLSLPNTPRFFSLTITQDDSPSLLMDKDLIPYFGKSIRGDSEGTLVPIFLDFAKLPTETTGIICGIGGMIDSHAKKHGLECPGLSYLSTARAGCVLISAEGTQSNDAQDAIIDDDSDDDNNNDTGNDGDNEDSQLNPEPLDMGDIQRSVKRMQASAKQMQTSVTEVGPIDIPAPKIKYKPYHE